MTPNDEKDGGQIFPAQIEMAAKAAHEVNRAYCKGLHDDSQVPWDIAPAWQRESAIKGAELIAKNSDTPPSASHESWLSEKRDAGWKYGPVKDAEKKEHPCFVPYNQLSPDQKAKDALFGMTVRGVLGITKSENPLQVPGDNKPCTQCGHHQGGGPGNCSPACDHGESFVQKASRFDYVKYDEAHAKASADFKEEVELLEKAIECFPNGRSKTLALTKLEECFMWIGKMLRDGQVSDNE